jgi:hypothetical protein
MMKPERIDEIYEKAWQGEIGVRPALILAVEEAAEEALEEAARSADEMLADVAGGDRVGRAIRSLKPKRAAEAERGEG